uniref:Uncharacterized protein n=1 Tax=Hyaloperonospora arabidopsidis (strain Emoy2) TaxID=559515 RepID=M4B438_HYAAE
MPGTPLPQWTMAPFLYRSSARSLCLSPNRVFHESAVHRTRPIFQLKTSTRWRRQTQETCLPPYWMAMVDGRSLNMRRKR